VGCYRCAPAVEVKFSEFRSGAPRLLPTVAYNSKHPSPSCSVHIEGEVSSSHRHRLECSGQVYYSIESDQSLDPQRSPHRPFGQQIHLQQPYWIGLTVKRDLYKDWGNDHVMVCINPSSPLLLFSSRSLSYVLRNILKIPRNIWGWGTSSMHLTKSIDYAIVVEGEWEIYSILTKESAKLPSAIDAPPRN
jgi:hypothetical protein